MVFVRPRPDYELHSFTLRWAKCIREKASEEPSANALMDVGVACPVLYPLLLRPLLAHAFSFVRHGGEGERKEEEESGAERSERSESPRKFSSHDEVNQIAIAAIAQLPECGERGRAARRCGSCVMVISTGPNERGKRRNGSDLKGNSW